MDLDKIHNMKLSQLTIITERLEGIRSDTEVTLKTRKTNTWQSSVGCGSSLMDISGL